MFWPQEECLWGTSAILVPTFILFRLFKAFSPTSHTKSLSLGRYLKSDNHILVKTELIPNPGVFFFFPAQQVIVYCEKKMKLTLSYWFALELQSAGKLNRWLFFLLHYKLGKRRKRLLLPSFNQLYTDKNNNRRWWKEYLLQAGQVSNTLSIS